MAQATGSPGFSFQRIPNVAPTQVAATATRLQMPPLFNFQQADDGTPAHNAAGPRSPRPPPALFWQVPRVSPASDAPVSSASQEFTFWQDAVPVLQQRATPGPQCPGQQQARQADQGDDRHCSLRRSDASFGSVGSNSSVRIVLQQAAASFTIASGPSAAPATSTACPSSRADHSTLDRCGSSTLASSPPSQMPGGKAATPSPQSLLEDRPAATILCSPALGLHPTGKRSRRAHPADAAAGKRRKLSASAEWRHSLPFLAPPCEEWGTTAMEEEEEAEDKPSHKLQDPSYRPNKWVPNTRVSTTFLPDDNAKDPSYKPSNSWAYDPAYEPAEEDCEDEGSPAATAPVQRSTSSLGCRQPVCRRTKCECSGHMPANLTLLLFW